MKFTITTILAATMLAMFAAPTLGRGRGGGGFSRGGGGVSRPAVHAPSMSRANMSRPNISRPSMPASRPNISRPNVSRPNVSRPNIPTTRPNISRPNIPSTRPSLPSNRPNLPNSKPNLPGTKPNLPGNIGNNRPNLPNVRPGGAGGNKPNLPGNFRPGGSGGNRPNFPSIPRPGGDRPSAGDVKDFLSLPGRDPGFSRPTLPENRPSLPGRDPGFSRPTLPENRPNLPDRKPNLPGERPNINLPDKRPNINLPGSGNNINRPNIEGGDKIRNRIEGGDNIRNRFEGGHNINVGDIDLDIRNNNINNIRNRWTNVNNRPFDRGWWVDPGFSRPPAYWRWHAGWGRYPGAWCWRPCTWVAVGSWFTWGAWAQPVTYSYGTNVVYRDNYVYVNNEQVGTATEYYEQAETLAASIPAEVEPDDVEWMPLGVYAVTDAEGNDTSMMLQLAVSKEGILAGTFYNSTNEKSRPVEGMVDRESQRAAWQFSDDEDSSLVMEAGIYDLTKEETPALLHFDADNSENWLLVRLPAPDDE